jgi:hypothetical protein
VRLSVVFRMFTRSRNIILPCLFSDLYVPLIPVYVWMDVKLEKEIFYRIKDTNLLHLATPIEQLQ